ncbi:dirigent protein 4-like [Dorcoceras hygrometricum]|uniref:Dirigent protein n=1 Tax=Dorcoceras hygrometricum TaxID=472368 RepID=A0A2Z7C2H6_9LAMI|nr:dirigent protein 4-like [Dorcoceras hygrometricum]
MEKGLMLPRILLLSIFTISVQSEYYSKTLPAVAQEKTTHLHFYLHDTLSGKTPTAIQIASPNSTNSKDDNPIPFGALFAIDDPLTEGPEITSKVIGNARGMYLSSSQDKFLTLVMYVDLGFSRGKFKGSSISVFSRNPITEKHREMAVVGGRGQFRMARGFIEVNTYYLNTSNGDAILEYNVTVVHP